MKKKIVTIVGARPQFIKAAAVSRKIAKLPELIEVIIHTGQHFDKNMSDIFFEELKIPQPNYNLKINNISHGAMTGRMLENIEKILLEEKPDIVLVYGDTNSTLAGALAARKLNIPIAHVEAGLRNFDMSIPEEVNRILTDRISDILFCPSDAAIRNLKAENFENFNCQIVKTGDVMMDSALYYSQESDKQSDIIETLDLIPENYILATLHRAGNTDNINNLETIISALNKISKILPILLPLHPRTRNIIEKNAIKTDFKIIEPVGYLDMVQLLKNGKAVITDSGGVQKESYMFKKNCLVLMEYTPWEELIQNGFSIQTKIEENAILNNFQKVLNLNPDYTINLYGNGSASREIINYIINYLDKL